MSNLFFALLPPAFIALVFVVIWIFLYPSYLLDAILFRNNDGALGHTISVLVWIFIVLASLFPCMAIDLINSNA